MQIWVDSNHQPLNLERRWALYHFELTDLFFSPKTNKSQQKYYLYVSFYSDGTKNSEQLVRPTSGTKHQQSRKLGKAVDEQK